MKEWAVWMANKMEEQLLRMEQLRLSEFVAYEKNWKKRLLMQFVGGIARGLGTAVGLRFWARWWCGCCKDWCKGICRLSGIS